MSAALRSALQDRIHCSLCDNNYNTTNRLPKVLPCAHTLCLACIHDAIDISAGTLQAGSTWPCPWCRRASGIGSQLDIANVPTNFAVTDFMHVMDEYGSDEQSSDKKWCSECGEGTSATHRCAACTEGDSFLCELHAQAHSKVKRFKGHVCTLINSLRDGYCNNHTDRKLTHYCTQHKCVMCESCVLQHIIEHECKKTIIQLHQAVTDERKALEPLVDKARTIVTQLSQLSQSARQARADVEQNSALCIEKVNNVCDLLINRINERRHVLLTSVETERIRKCTALNTQDKAIHMRIAGITSLLNEVDRLNDYGADASVLVQLASIHHTLTSMTAESYDKTTDEDGTLNLHLPDNAVNNMTLQIDFMGKIISDKSCILQNSDIYSAALELSMKEFEQRLFDNPQYINISLLKRMKDYWKSTGYNWYFAQIGATPAYGSTAAIYGTTSAAQDALSAYMSPLGNLIATISEQGHPSLQIQLGRWKSDLLKGKIGVCAVMQKNRFVDGHWGGTFANPDGYYYVMAVLLHHTDAAVESFVPTFAKRDNTDVGLEDIVYQCMSKDKADRGRPHHRYLVRSEA